MTDGSYNHVRHRIGCVSFLNAKPLIEPLEGRADVEITYVVPSELLRLIETGRVDTALLPVVDYQRSTNDLVLVPAGMIGCDGATLTVRIFSKVPPHRIKGLHGDTDSHTSVILAQVILQERHQMPVNIVPWEAPAAQGEDWKSETEPESLLLIGDKVVNAAPARETYPYQLDLGEEWKALTGLPFVFAMWMTKVETATGELFQLLAEAQRVGATMTEALLDRHAQEKRWPRELARRYFTTYLRYAVTAEARQGLERFYELAGKHALLESRRPPRYLEV